MKKIVLTLLSAFLISLTFAQTPKVKNLDLKIENNKVLFNYDLITKKTNEIQTIELFLIDDDFNIFVPKKIKGDFGTKVLPGENKQIEWDIYNDDLSISQKLKPKIIVNGIKKGGASNVVYSILVPGLGDYFVADHKDMIIKPYVRTITTLGVIGLGIYALMEREKVLEMGWIKKDQSYFGDPTDVYWGETGGYDYDNAFFSNDAELLLITGATLWIGDIIWVYIKGLENDKLRVFSNYSFGVEKGNPTIKYSINF
ncbi:MAG: hypothetical protein A2041_12000 [Bacteroidetes bacterium GWA2_31_9b]|nr:MAG: hypothetical protein A2041_12000 [Bacteroidetes bacterium GWA2_31_9b]